MKVTTTPFDLRGWRLRLGWTQIQAAAELGLSAGGYIAAEYRNSDRPGFPCNATVAKLATMLEAARALVAMSGRAA